MNGDHPMDQTQQTTEPEVLVSISLTFPNLDRTAIGQHLKPVMDAILDAGGITSSLSIQPYDPEDD